MLRLPGRAKADPKQVGSRTTLDFVNSFPHLRNRNILPRLDTQLVHGMTIDPTLSEPSPSPSPYP